MMMLNILLKIMLSPMSRSGMPLTAYAEFMALRGQGTGHCMYTLAHAIGCAKGMDMHMRSCCYLPLPPGSVERGQ